MSKLRKFRLAVLYLKVAHAAPLAGGFGRKFGFSPPFSQQISSVRCSFRGQLSYRR